MKGGSEGRRTEAGGSVTASGKASARIILVRHGETVWNLEGRMQGHRDSPLTTVGRSQARSVARRIARFPVRALYSSDLGRARETVRPIAEATGLEPQFDVRLRERGLGIFEGLTEAEIVASHPAEWALFRRRDPDWVVPKGESARQRTERSTACLEELVGRHPGETIVAVTHGGVLDGLFRFVVGLPLSVPRRFVIPNGALNVLRFEEERWMLEMWGSRDHEGSAELLDDA